MAYVLSFRGENYDYDNDEFADALATFLDRRGYGLEVTLKYIP